jgi:hypothetical protein
MENDIYENNMKNPFGMIVSYTNIHLFVKYEICVTNYVVKITITWSFGLKFETSRCLQMIDLFVKIFLQILLKIKFIIFHSN